MCDKYDTALAISGQFQTWLHKWHLALPENDPREYVDFLSVAYASQNNAAFYDATESILFNLTRSQTSNMCDEKASPIVLPDSLIGIDVASSPTLFFFGQCVDHCL
jgi:hypothetical protein